MLHFAGLGFDVCGMLEWQLQTYTSDLAQVHLTLSSLYQKLGTIELELSERQERGLTRKDKKKLQWSRCEIRKAVKTFEFQQASLQEYLRQCHDLLSCYQGQGLPLGPKLSPPTSQPGSSTQSTLVSALSTGESPIYWDLSMLPERVTETPTYAGSTDSGFFEPVMYAQPTDFGAATFDVGNHIFAHEIVARQDAISPTTIAQAPEETSSAKDPQVMPASASLTARRFSEAAIQLIESRLEKNPKNTHRRGISWGGGLGGDTQCA